MHRVTRAGPFHADTDGRLHPKRFAHAHDVIRRFVDEERIPGAVAVIGSSKKILAPFAYGWASLTPRRLPLQDDTLYDCASLTKVVVTTTIALMLVDEGRLHLDEPVSDYVPEFLEASIDTLTLRRRITMRQLLTHTSGLPAWHPLYAHGKGQPAMLHALCRTPLDSEPECAVTYSCLGYILLGIALERNAGKSLDQLAQERIFEPLHMNDSGYRPDPSLLDRIAPTEVIDGHLIHGVVHDENARAMGGVSGNAGLFATAGDLALFAQMILRRGRTERGNRILSTAAIDAAIQRQTEGIHGEARGLGWLLKSHGACPVGDLFGAHSFGHTGFTGTSLWIDPAKDLFVILLTNRVHPTRANKAHLHLRPLFHNAVAAALS